MALYHLENAVVLNGVLVSGTWTPREPRLIVVGRSSSKNRFQVYPTIKDDIEGTGTFIELTTTTTYERVALDYVTAATLQQYIEAVPFVSREIKQRQARSVSQIV